MSKYLFIYRSPAAASDFQPSPEEMQGMMQQWANWKAQFSTNIVELGDGLKPTGRVLQVDDNVSDGPFVEAKEILGGFSIIEAESYDKALEIARACPIRHVPGNSVEIREMAGY